MFKVLTKKAEKMAEVIVPIEDVNMSSITDLVLEAVDAEYHIYIAGDDESLVTKAVKLLNKQVREELEKLKVLENNQEEEKEMVNKQVEVEVEVKAEEKVEVTTPRKRLGGGGAAALLKDKVAKLKDKEEEKEMVAEVEVEVETEEKKERKRLGNGGAGNTTGRKSTGSSALEKTAKKKEKGDGVGRGRLKTKESLTGGGFVKFEGPWYLNTSLYPALSGLERMIQNYQNDLMIDEDLGIQDLAIVETEDVFKYKDREDIEFIIQVKSNGIILDFPIKESVSEFSKSDLSCSSIGWVSKKGGGLRPVYGQWVPNKLEVKWTCSCSRDVVRENHTGNLYCPNCKTRHADAMAAVVPVSDAVNLVDKEVTYKFVTNGNMWVNPQILAVVLAFAQYEMGYSMYGVVAE